MRLVFAGTPAVALPTLRRLASEHDVRAVITRPDAPLGRKRVMTPSPVAQEAEALGLPVIKAARLDAQTTAQVAQTAPELGVIVAYGGLVREPLLSTPVHGWINLHFSLLPRWRGAAPVQRALMAGDATLGSSVFRLVEALDAGEVFAERPVELPSDATADEALSIMADDGAGLVAQVVADIGAGRAVGVAQDETAVTLAPKLTLEDGRLDLDRPFADVYARYRGATTEPGAFTTIAGERLKVLDAAPSSSELRPAPGAFVLDGRTLLLGTADEPLELRRVQPAGKGPMAAADWWRGQRHGEDARAGA